jgi:transposase InsO family protein
MQEDGLRGEANPQVNGHLIGIVAGGESASRTLSRWRHGFEPRWDYERESRRISDRPKAYKTELIRRRGPWKGIDDVEFGTLEWVDWFNHRRLLEPIGDVPPAELQAEHRRKEDLAILNEPSLR